MNIVIIIIVMMNKFMFINREKELSTLRDALGSNKAELILIYGRRRIGKTTLVLYATRKLNAAYLYVDYANPTVLLRSFSKILAKTLKLPSGVIAEDFESLFKLFPHIDAVVLDEFQRLYEINPSIVTALQKLWDLELSRARTKLIIVGSSIGLMERIGLSPAAPLFGRATRVIRLAELDYRSTRAFYPNSGEEDRIGYYAILGGVPAYHRFFEEKLGLFENIHRSILNPTSPLYSEAERLLTEETRNPTPYMSILAAISQGKTTYTEIADYAGIERTALTRYLQTLRNNLRLVESIQALGTTGRRYRRYKITSNYFRFWFRYVYPYRSLLETGQVDKVLGSPRELEPHIARVFEEICREHLHLLNREGRVSFTQIGRWWHKDIEVDWIAVDERTSTAYYVECKWVNKPVSRDVLNKLIGKSQYFPWRKGGRKDIYILYSRKGFTWEETDPTVIQISLEDMEKTFDKYWPQILASL